MLHSNQSGRSGYYCCILEILATMIIIIIIIKKIWFQDLAPQRVGWEFCHSPTDCFVILIFLFIHPESFGWIRQVQETGILLFCFGLVTSFVLGSIIIPAYWSYCCWPYYGYCCCYYHYYLLIVIDWYICVGAVGGWQKSHINISATLLLLLVLLLSSLLP